MDPSCRSSSPTRSTAGPQRVGAALPEGRLLDAVFSLQFLARTEYVLLVDPAGVGKSFIAQAIWVCSHRGRPLRSLSARRRLLQSNGTSEIRSLLRQDLPLPGPAHPRRPRPTQDAPTAVNGPKRVGHRQASKGQLRHHLNRAVDEWLGLFDDPILGNAALDRLANANYQIVTEGQCCRERLSTHKALLD